jgi:acyl-[acyl-carrier-protein]-phospholipid O-acyltransferase/long-chain-fatty-acid--[acyl-carrier-protein] ligase
MRRMARRPSSTPCSTPATSTAPRSRSSRTRIAVPSAIGPDPRQLRAGPQDRGDDQARRARGDHAAVQRSGAVVTFFALHAFGRTPTMLNFTAGLRNLRAACELAGVKRVLTSHRFIEQAKLHDLIDALEAKADDRLSGGCAGHDRHRRQGCSPPPPASSRASSAPRQAERSGRGAVHLGQLRRAARRGAEPGQPGVERDADRRPHRPRPRLGDVQPLPVFHCLGLTGGVILPLLTGMKAFEYPSPLHTKQIPPCSRTPAPRCCWPPTPSSTSTPAPPRATSLSGLKFVVCGAEKVRAETHNLINEKFGGVPVLEGYGATEASPVIAVNKPGDNRRGTVGGLLPQAWNRRAGRGHRGRRQAAGARAQHHGRLSARGRRRRPPEGGWHDTGDVVTITDDGWITIKGRVKRFAKIGGEMVSLTAAEDLASAVWPDCRHAVISMPDPKKGERWCWSPTGRTRRHLPGRPRPERSARRSWPCPRKILKAQGAGAGHRQDRLCRDPADGRPGRQGCSASSSCTWSSPARANGVSTRRCASDRDPCLLPLREKVSAEG